MTTSAYQDSKFNTGRGSIEPNLVDRLRREFLDLRDAMLSDDQFVYLSGIPRWFRGPATVWCLLRRLFLKLTPTRRLVLIVGVVLAAMKISVGHESWDFTGVGILLMLFVLMLELKDKLLATTELEDGHAIQRALLPNQSPHVPGWSPWLFTRSANEVGGDLIDFIPVAQGRFAVAVGDVAGKGLKAALLTAKLQATLRALGPDTTSLPALAARVNSIICRDGLPQMFSSLVYAELAPGGGTVRLINAGHLPPLIVRKSGIAQSVKGGPALGLMPGAEFREETVELDPGDLILFYSDGLVEARNESGEFFGEDRLRAVLSSSSRLTSGRIGEELLAAVDRFRGEARAHDDLTLLVLKRN